MVQFSVEGHKLFQEYYGTMWQTTLETPVNATIHFRTFVVHVVHYLLEIIRENNTTLQGINISHLGKRKIIFKMPFLGDMLISWRVIKTKKT